MIRMTHLQLKPRNRGRRIVAMIPPPGKSAAQFHIIVPNRTLNALGRPARAARSMPARSSLTALAISPLRFDPKPQSRDSRERPHPHHPAERAHVPMPPKKPK